MVMKERVRCIIKCVNNFNICNCDGWTIFDKKKICDLSYLLYHIRTKIYLKYIFYTDWKNKS